MISSERGWDHDRTRAGILAEIFADRAGGGLSALLQIYSGTGGKPPPPHRRIIQIQEVLLKS